jgi:hypothetical protein
MRTVAIGVSHLTDMVWGLRVPCFTVSATSSWIAAVTLQTLLIGRLAQRKNVPVAHAACYVV